MDILKDISFYLCEENISDMIMYHGTKGKGLLGGDIKRHLFWVTPDKELAYEYGDDVQQYKITMNNPLVLRHAKVTRTPDEFVNEIMYATKNRDMKKLMPFKEIIQNLDDENEMELWEIWDNDPNIVKIFQALGYDGIKTSESGSPTYGVFSTAQLAKA